MGGVVQENVGSVDTGSYSSGYACAMCLSKHVCKALVEMGEFVDDRSRSEELALAIGDIGCAEDHAKALNLDQLAVKLRGLRTSLFTDPESVLAELKKLAPSVVFKARHMGFANDKADS